MKPRLTVALDDREEGPSETCPLTPNTASSTSSVLGLRRQAETELL